MRLLRLLAMGVALLGSQAATQTTPYETTGTTETEAAAQPDQMGLREDDWARLTAAVHLSGQGPFRFLVDTGSNKTAISRELATRLALVPGRPARLHSMTGLQMVPTAMVPSLRLGARQLSISEAPLLEAQHMGADGILGLDSLRSQRVVFDFRNLTLAVVPATEPTLVEERGTIVVRARRRNGHLIVTNARADGMPLQLVVDTGAEVSVGNEALRQALLRSRSLDHVGRAALYSVTGDRLIGEQMILNELEFGGLKLQNMVILFADAHTFRQLNLDRRPALLLGMNGMRAFDAVSIDFAKKRLRLKVSSLQGVRTAHRRNEKRTD